MAQQVKELWAKRYQAEYYNNISRQIALDAEGNSYVSGTSSSGRGPSQIRTVKYSSSGEQLWEVNYDEGRNISLKGIAVDNKGEAYLLAEANGNYVTIKYDATTGNEVWRRIYDSGGSTLDSPNAIAVDNSGGVYVTGYSQTTPYSVDYLTIRYDASTGAESWRSNYNGGYYNVATSIVVDNKGGVYVTGQSYTSDYFDYATVRYNAADGTESWATKFDGGADDRAVAIVVDNTDGVYVTGNSSDAGGDYFLTLRYSTIDGSQSWLSRYDGGNHDIVKSLAVDNAGGVYVLGSSAGPDGFYDYATLRYATADGTQSWVSKYDGGSEDRAAAIAVDKSGGVYVTGYSQSADNSTFATLRYNALDGATAWQVNSTGTQDEAAAIALDAQGNIFVTGQSLGDENYDFLTIKYSQSSCNNLALAQIEENGAPAPNNVSVQNTSTYSASIKDFTSYSWQVKDVLGNVIQSRTDASLRVSWKEAGLYTIYLTYGNGCEAKTITHKVAVYDTKAGLVVGGGWYNSPQNNELPYMKKKEQAYFGFYALYPAPSSGEVWGTTVLWLRQSKMQFISSSMEPMRLIIFGDNVNYVGKGSINGKGGYAFLVSAVDGNFSATTDKLRIKIWEEASGKVVYDNQKGAQDGAIAKANIKAGEILLYNGGTSLSATELALASAYVQAAPEHFYNYPNNFSSNTTISFALETEEDFVLEVFDMKGTLVKNISAGKAELGKTYEYSFEANGLEEGIYIARLTTATTSKSIKMLLKKK
ncbi:SBBP repeat-containing protein [Pontibacter harenae]|uniref:SBBP repeat-containing protein n=1 Tax=Pontibacter harenae TaxID=2894083 RepID=UPI001E4DBCC9|nr:SBBP repeat-containing protein [Pontibacter harenae]MCC9168617.1 SBBP repeat-containing protein [Pontibacter harenae]